MEALSVMQPWAWLMAMNIKDIENRTWKADFRGEFLIHAGKKFDWEGFLFIEDTLPSVAQKIRVHFGIESELGNWRTLRFKLVIRKGEFGGIVGKSTLVGCVTESDSPWFFGPYGFVLRNSQPLPFIKYPGKLKFFKVEVANGK